MTCDTVMILGAGFSKAAGLPLQSELSNALIENQESNQLEQTITRAIGEYLDHCFGWDPRSPPPSLEEMFTMLDLSANNGHNLGRPFQPKRLRALRRMMIYRVLTILRPPKAMQASLTTLLQHFVSTENPSCSFVVLNWDIVLETHLRSLTEMGVDYGFRAHPWNPNPPTPHPLVKVAKVHGSGNWAYCDNCHMLFFDMARQLPVEIRAGLVKADFRLYEENLQDSTFDGEVGLPDVDRCCRNCQCAVGPHIATFSYAKSYRTHAFAATWQAAEWILSEAQRWIFIGYSLPEADFEFKHLLKVAELKTASMRRKQIDVVLKEDCEAETSYSTFFGADNVNIVQDGVEGFVSRLWGKKEHL